MAQTTTPQASPPVAQQPQQPARSKYFFLRRYPRLSVSRIWVRPPDAEYQKMLKNEGLISADMVDTEGSKALRDDLAELEQHLLPHMWRLNQEALFYQNHYYLYQWTFIITTFLTTALASITVFAYNSNADVWLGLFHLTDFLGVLTAIASALAAGVSYLGANETPQQKWFNARIKTENLRSTYFLFLARQTPFAIDNTAERVRQLQLKTLEVLEG